MIVLTPATTAVSNGGHTTVYGTLAVWEMRAT